MPAANPKNSMLGSASMDLGLDTLMSEELLNEEEKRRKRKEGKDALPSQYGDSVLGNAAMSLFSGMAGPR